MFLKQKLLLEKTATIKRLEYSPLDNDLKNNELKKQTGIAKDHYKFFTEQINTINNNREDDIQAEDCLKTEDGEIIDNTHQKYLKMNIRI